MAGGNLRVGGIEGDAQLDAVLFDLDGTLLPSVSYREIRHSGGGPDAVANLLSLMMTPFPDVENLLAHLSSALKTGVVTSAPRWYADALLSEHFADVRIDTVVTRDDVRRLKPDPEPIKLALQRLGVSPERAVYIGDEPEDMQAAHSARVTFIGAGWGDAVKVAEVTAPVPMGVLDLLRCR